MPTYIVTGAAGFIGARVTQMLLDEGNRVIGIDNLNDAYDPRLKEWRLDRFRSHPHFTWHQLDISDKTAVFALLGNWPQGETPAAVINLAARAGVRPSVGNPWIYLDTNVTGTLNLLELCRQAGIEKFVLSSTSSLYGADNPQPFREDANTDYPLSPYAASKKAAETMCFTYHHLHQIDVTVFRYFTVYGPAGRPDMSPLRFVRWISEGHPVTIYGDGEQSRDFTYIDDIARGTIAGLQKVGYEVFNLGSDTPIKLIETIGIMEEIIGQKAVLQFEPPHVADMFSTWADIQKARSVLGWEPRENLPSGIAALVNWYRKNRDWL